MFTAAFRKTGVLALGMTVSLAIGSAASAADRPSDDEVRKQLSLFFSGGCQSTITSGELQSLRPQRFDFDGDGEADPFVDIPTEVLAQHGCDVPSARAVWASGRDYALRFSTETSQAAASPQTAAVEPSIAETGEATPSELSQDEALLSGSTPEGGPQALPPSQSANRAADASGSNAQSQPAASSPYAAWMLLGVGTALLVLGVAVILLLNASATRYGYDLLLNRMNFVWLIVVVAAVIGIATRPDGLLIAAPIAVGGVGLILLNNIRRTNLLIGAVGTLIQPFALVLIIFGLLWLRGFLAGGSGGGGGSAEAGRLQRIRDHERRVQGYVRH